MTGNREIRFRIDGYTRDTLPMARLAEYMADLAQLLGHSASVHFLRVDEGSAVLVQTVDRVALPKVRARVDQVRSGNAAPEAMEAYRRMNRRLKDDNSIALLTEDDGAEVIRFPGREEPEAITFGPFSQATTLDGRIVRLGGRGDPVPVHIQGENRMYVGHADRALAKTLATYLFDTELRLSGTGRWIRDNDGTWELKRFNIASFQVLSDEVLGAVVARLRDIPGSEWPTLTDPWKELERIRVGTDEVS